jgi:hypothetical protein
MGLLLVALCNMSPKPQQQRLRCHLPRAVPHLTLSLRSCGLDLRPCPSLSTKGLVILADTAEVIAP